MTRSILIAGVGGQGIILAGKVISNALLKSGYDVKMSELHGMSQRGGSVTSQIRFGKKTHTPLIEKGDADILLAFEKLEALRYIDYLSQDGTLILNDFEIPPMSTIVGGQTYPGEEMFDELNDKVESLVVLDAAEIAKENGNIRAQNIVLVGALVKALDLGKDIFEETIREVVPERFLEVNLKSLNSGWSIAKANEPKLVKA